MATVMLIVTELVQWIEWNKKIVSAKEIITLSFASANFLRCSGSILTPVLF